MAAFVPLPWLNSSAQFMRAITAGDQAGLERQRLGFQAQAQSQMHRGGGAPNMSVNFGPSPIEQAQAALLRSKAAAAEQELQDSAAYKSAFDAQTDLIRRGATPQE